VAVVTGNFAQTERLLAFSFVNADVLIELGEDLRIIYASGATKNLVGREHRELIGYRLLEMIGENDRLMVQAALDVLPNNARMNPLFIQLADRDDRPLVLSGYRMDQGQRRFYLTMARAGAWPVGRPSSEHRDRETGLLDAPAFAEAAARGAELARMANADSRLTLFEMLGLDRAQQSLGPRKTMQLMAEVGALMRAESLDGMTAGRVDEARFGLLHRADFDPGVLEADLAKTIRETAGHAAKVSFERITIDLPANAMGVEDSGRVLAYTVRRFAQRGAGPFTIRSLSDGMQQMLTDTVARVSALKESVAARDFNIALQPIVWLKDRRPHHFEALARPKSGGSPAEIVAFAEQIGMVQDFDMMIARRVVELMRRGDAIGCPLEIAINVSALSLESDAFIAEFRKLLKGPAAFRRRLLIEVTESMQLRDLHLAEQVLQQLRADGHRICLDDFGAGAASFQYIQALSVEFVKIDGAYVRKLTTGNGRERAILRAMASLCRDLDIGTIAEMVETEEEARHLLEIGVAFGQGYLFGRPTLESELDLAALAGSLSSRVRKAMAGPKAIPRRGARRHGAREEWA